MSDNIPFEIQVEIMNRLPVKSLLQFRSVSKSWKCMIDSSSFVFTYGVRKSKNDFFNYTKGFQGFMLSIDETLIHTPVDTDLNLSNHKTIGTSQGLWCFSFGNNLSATLWNPSVKKSIGIFVPVFNNIPVCHKILLGFGVPPDTLDPTIVKISYPVSRQGVKKLTIKVEENAVHQLALTANYWCPIESFSELPIYDDDDDDATESDNDGDNITHPKLSTFSTDDQEEQDDEEEQEEDEEEISDQLVRTPSDYQTTDESEKQTDDDKVKDGEGDKEGDVMNVNLEGGDVDITEDDTTKDTEDAHVTLTAATPVESDLSKLKQSNPFAEAISSIPGIVNEYLGSKMKEAVDVAIQLKSNKLREEAQAENQEFLNSLDANMQKLIKD
ncbi:F-box domain containing protein [Tanacetum coccineum]